MATTVPPTNSVTRPDPHRMLPAVGGRAKQCAAERLQCNDQPRCGCDGAAGQQHQHEDAMWPRHTGLPCAHAESHGKEHERQTRQQQRARLRKGFRGREHSTRDNTFNGVTEQCRGAKPERKSENSGYQRLPRQSRRRLPRWQVSGLTRIEPAISQQRDDAENQSA